MLMSIFSAFDALSAESFGVVFSRAPAREAKVDASTVDRKGAPAPSPSPTTIHESLKEDKVGNSKEPPADVNRSHHQRPQQQRRPRFAPELDGVNCFEFIVPY